MNFSTNGAAVRDCEEARPHLGSPVNSFTIGKEVVSSYEAIFEEPQMRACVYLSEYRRARDIDYLIFNLEMIERGIESIKFASMDLVKDWINSQKKGFSKYFDIQLNQNGFAQLARNKMELNNRIESMGLTILITNDSDLTPKQILQQYRQKDRVEKAFDVLKNELQENRIWVHGVTRMDGKMFLTFISLIIQTELTNRMQAAGLMDKVTLPELLTGLKKIQIFIRPQGNPAYLSEISKTHRVIFEKLKVKLPQLS